MQWTVVLILSVCLSVQVLASLFCCLVPPGIKNEACSRAFGPPRGGRCCPHASHARNAHARRWQGFPQDARLGERPSHVNTCRRDPLATHHQAQRDNLKMFSRPGRPRAQSPCPNLRDGCTNVALATGRPRKLGCMSH